MFRMATRTRTPVAAMCSTRTPMATIPSKSMPPNHSNNLCVVFFFLLFHLLTLDSHSTLHVAGTVVVAAAVVEAVEVTRAKAEADRCRLPSGNRDVDLTTRSTTILVLSTAVVRTLPPQLMAPTHRLPLLQQRPHRR